LLTQSAQTNIADPTFGTGQTFVDVVWDYPSLL
jgi:hypothetical protein